MSAQSLYEKLWDAHVVCELDNGESLIYIDRHLVHEVTSPQAFDGLRMAGRQPLRTGATLAMHDHVVSTRNSRRYANSFTRKQLEELDKNCAKHSIRLFPAGDARQGIVHVVGPEQGFVLPGMTVVCGDSHTSTNGALGCLAFGIGTSEVEHVLATQCLRQSVSKKMLIDINGRLAENVDAKDVILGIIRAIGTAGASGFAIEYAGDTVAAMGVEERMTMCNMSIEAGARSGTVAVDEKTLEYVRDRRMAPHGRMLRDAEEYWRTLVSDPDAVYDRKVDIDTSTLKPHVTWGTSPEMVEPVTGKVPSPDSPEYKGDVARRENVAKALEYMGLEAGMPITDIRPEKIFIGSCSNGRLSDLRRAAEQVRGKKIAKSVSQAIVVPGSGLVREDAEKEGLDKIFRAAGFEWRLPGCSMCLAMNDDLIGPKERCASTSNRNFEGRQGHLARTHLVSPSMAAAAAVHGHFVDVSAV